MWFSKLDTHYAFLQEFDLKFKPKKCALFQRRVEFLGRQVNPQGVDMGDSYMEAARDWAPTRSTKDVDRFLGFDNYIEAL